MKSFKIGTLLSILLFNLIISCKSENTITLKGEIKGLNSKWIYLHNNYPVGSPAIDSAQVINGKFEFSYHRDTVFQPRLVFLKSHDADSLKQYEFSDNIKHFDEGKEIERFIANKPKNKDDFPDSKFLTVKDETSNLIDTTKKLNMVVFWASWCGPCRKEIPSLKKLDSAFTNSNLRIIVSVSIDKDKSRWLKAVDEENMPWQQLLISAKEKEIADSKYNLGWVPQIYLVNNKNKVINKIDGFSKENEEKIKIFITNYLAKN